MLCSFKDNILFLFPHFSFPVRVCACNSNTLVAALCCFQSEFGQWYCVYSDISSVMKVQIV